MDQMLRKLLTEDSTLVATLQQFGAQIWIQAYYNVRTIGSGGIQQEYVIFKELNV